MRWNARPSEPALLDALARHAGGAGAQLEQAHSQPLAGGFVAKAVERLSLVVRAPGGEVIEAVYVRKTCPAREVRALEAVAAVPGAGAGAELIAAWVANDAPQHPDASGFVSPFYPGPALHFGDPIPDDVLTTLARVHAAAAVGDAPGWAWTFDTAHIDRLQQFSEQALAASKRFKASTPDHAAWAARFARAAAAPVLRETAEQLPRTLTHGDMHPANIMARADGSPVIIDWGNACLAPAMLDLANIIEMGSPQWEAYVAAYRAAGGAFDLSLAERAFLWASAITGLMYVGWAVDNSDRATSLIAQIEDATGRLAAISA